MAVEHGDAGGELVERAAMRLRHPHQRRAQRIRLAGIDRDADAAAADIDGAHVVDAPLAADHDRQPGGEIGRVLQSPFHGAAVGAVEQLELALVGVAEARSLGRTDIGRVGESERTVLALGPDRPGCRRSEAAQHLGLVGERLVAQIGFGEIPAQAREFANPDNGLATDGAADGFQRMAMRGGQRQLEPVAAVAQRIHSVVHLERRFRRQPGSEGEHALRGGVARQHHRDVAGNLRAVVARRPGDQDLRLGEQQRAEAVGLELQFPDPRAQPRLVLRRAHARTHQQDRGHYREAEQRKRGGEHRKFLPVEVQQFRKCANEVGGLSRRSRQQRRESAPDQAVAHERCAR
ncbi:hypothetical protein ACVJGC_003875 [Bradyrhizobium diazoefficiens]